jgi:hypothetical protein
MSDERERDQESLGYDAETDRHFDEYLRTAAGKGDFAIPKMRITRPAEISAPLRAELVETMRRAHAERQLIERVVKCRSYGDFFKCLKQVRNLNWNLIAEYLHRPVEEIGKIERNELHPTDLPLEVHKALATLFNIPAEYYTRMMSNLLLAEAERSAAAGGLQFARRDDRAKPAREELLAAWCAGAPAAEREQLRRFKELIHSLETQMSGAGPEA